MTKTLISGLFAICLTALCLVSPGRASAQNVTYNASGVFDAPASGTWSGVFTVNTATGAVISANFQTTAGLAQDGATPLPASTFVYAGASSSTQLTYATATPATGLRGGFLDTSPSLSAATTVIQFRDGICGDATCSSVDVTSTPGVGRRAFTNTISVAPVSTVPTMTEWAMILFGLILAGGAAVVIQRRRVTT